VLAGWHGQSQHPPPQHARRGLSARRFRQRCGAERPRAEHSVERRSYPVGPGRRRDFDFERATRQIAEAASASFLAPHRREETTADPGRDSPATVAADADPRAGYEAFLADIVAVAQRFGFEPEESPGRDEPRLRGLRQ